MAAGLCLGVCTVTCIYGISCLRSKEVMKIIFMKSQKLSTRILKQCAKLDYCAPVGIMQLCNKAVALIFNHEYALFCGLHIEGTRTDQEIKY
jgi:hypothetical protein